MIYDKSHVLCFIIELSLNYLDFNTNKNNSKKDAFLFAN